jgi:uncharacterized glyoxalase superfamily protein PhnB
VKVQPHLNFDGRCEEALDFYRRALGAEVTALMRFKDSPEPAMILPGSENKVMYSSFRVGDAIMLAADGPCQGQTNFQGSPWLSHCRTKQQRNSGLPRFPMAGRSRARWPKPSFRRALASWPTGSG